MKKNSLHFFVILAFFVNVGNASAIEAPSQVVNPALNPAVNPAGNSAVVPNLNLIPATIQPSEKTAVNTTNQTAEKAAQNTTIMQPVLMKKPEERKPFFSRLLSNLEDSREGMSTFLVDKSNEIDLLFANPNYLATRNTTNLRVSNLARVAEEEGFANEFDISFKLNLPRSQDKLQFQFDQAVDDFKAGDGSQNLNSNLNQASEQRQNGRGRAGINFYQNAFDTDFRLTAGLRMKSQLVPWTNVKTRNYLLRSKNDKHLMELIQDFYGESLEGLEHKGYLAYTYKINEQYLFRVSNESLYRDFDNSFRMNQGLTIFHHVDYGHSLGYGFSVTSVNPAAQSVYFVDSYGVSVSYRRRLYKRHYYLTVRPGLTSPKVKDWEVSPSIQVGIDIFFGTP